MVPILEYEHLRGRTHDEDPADDAAMKQVNELTGRAPAGAFRGPSRNQITLPSLQIVPYLADKRGTGRKGVAMESCGLMEIEARTRATRRLLKPPCRRCLAAGTVMENRAKLNELVNGRNA